MGNALSQFTKCGSAQYDSDDDDHKKEQASAGKPQSSNYGTQELERNFNSLRLSHRADLCGFHFNTKGQLVDGTECPYEYSKLQQKNDANFYPKLSEKVMNYVQDILVDVFSLDKITIPVDALEKEPQTFIFASKNALTTSDKLMILIHGSGNVVAGIWSRKVIITDNLHYGSQLAYIKRALSEGYEIVILNTNVNSQLVEQDGWVGDVPIRGSGSPEEHAIYVWDNFVVKSKAHHIAIVAHSYGGVVTAKLASRRKENFLKRVFAVAFTDSVHRLDQSRTPTEVVRFFCTNARNWVSSDEPLDASVGKGQKQPLSDAPRVSAGDSRHEWTSHSACVSVFRFFKEKYRDRISSLMDRR